MGSFVAGAFDICRGTGIKRRRVPKWQFRVAQAFAAGRGSAEWLDEYHRMGDRRGRGGEPGPRAPVGGHPRGWGAKKTGSRGAKKERGPPFTKLLYPPPPEGPQL